MGFFEKALAQYYRGERINFKFENNGKLEVFGDEVEKIGTFSEICFGCDQFFLGDR